LKRAEDYPVRQGRCKREGKKVSYVLISYDVVPFLHSPQEYKRTECQDARREGEQERKEGSRRGGVWSERSPSR